MMKVTWAGRCISRVFWRHWDLTVGLRIWVSADKVQLSLVHGEEGSASQLHPGDLSWTSRLRSEVNP